MAFSPRPVALSLAPARRGPGPCVQGEGPLWGSFADIPEGPRLIRFALDCVAKVPKGATADFPPKNEKNDNRRSIEPQSHYENRL